MTGAQLINAIGIPTTVVAFLYIGAKLHTLDSLESDVRDIIKPDLKDVRERFATLEGKSANLFVQNSPISLTTSGEKFLEESGLKEYIDSETPLLTATCSSNGSMANSYDVQQSAFMFFDTFQFPDELNDRLKSYAFSAGISMEVLRRIGAIYFRDLCLKSLGFKAEDLDIPKKPKS